MRKVVALGLAPAEAPSYDYVEQRLSKLRAPTMNQDGNRTHREDSTREGAAAVRRFARALVGTAGAHIGEQLAQEALALAQGQKSDADAIERAFAEAVRLNRRRIKTLGAQADLARDHGVRGEGERPENMAASIAAMPLDEREALLVIALARFGYEAAARILELPYSSVISRLMRGRARLEAVRAAPIPHRVAHLRVVK